MACIESYATAAILIGMQSNWKSDSGRGKRKRGKLCEAPHHQCKLEPQQLHGLNWEIDYVNFAYPCLSVIFLAIFAVVKRTIDIDKKVLTWESSIWGSTMAEKRKV